MRFTGIINPKASRAEHKWFEIHMTKKEWESFPVHFGGDCLKIVALSKGDQYDLFVPVDFVAARAKFIPYPYGPLRRSARIAAKSA